MRLRRPFCSRRRSRSSSSAPGSTRVTTPAAATGAVPTITRKQVATTTTTRRRDDDDRVVTGILDRSGRRHVRRHLDQDRCPSGDDRASQSQRVLDVALHRREDPAPVTRALLLAVLVAAAAAVRGTGRARPTVDAQRLHRRRTRAPARCSLPRDAHARLPIASITKLMTVLVDARAPQARPTSSPSIHARPPSASRASACVGGER